MTNDDTTKLEVGNRETGTPPHRPVRLDRRSFLGAVGVALLLEACGVNDGGDAPAGDGDSGAGDGAPGTPHDAGRDARVDAAGSRDAGAAVEAGGGDASVADTSDASLDAANANDASGSGDASSDASPDSGASDGGAPDPTGLLESSSFPLGVASGDATDTSAIFWARYTGTSPLELHIWEMNGAVYRSLVLTRAVVPSDGGFLVEDAAVLAAGRRYRYAFVEMGNGAPVARSPIGNLRAPVDGSTLAPVTIGAVSCTYNLFPKTTLERAGARTDLDAFLFLGDTTYADGASTRAQYRDKWAQNLGSSGYKALRASTAVLATWDDHEVDNDWNAETIDPTKLANARATFFEHTPMRRDAAVPDRIWRKRSWGKTVDVFILDCRSERLPSTRTTATAQYISRAQMDWLKAGLTASTAVFKLIMNSVPITEFPTLATAAESDRWQGYAAARTELLTHIDANGITGILWVSGDFHVASMGRVALSGPGKDGVEVLVGPGAQIGDIAALSLVAPQFDWASMSNNYTSFELDPGARTINVQFHGTSGQVLKQKSYTFP